MILPAFPFQSAALYEPKEPHPVMLIVAAFSGHHVALIWAKDELQAAYGQILLESSLFDFVETNYYEARMGPALKKIFFAFEHLIRPTQLTDIKLRTNELEHRCPRIFKDPRNLKASQHNSVSPSVPDRLLNLDPGFVATDKLVLATTKDQAHRIYLGRGIFAETTLRYAHGEWIPWPWTYPNYRHANYHVFFKQVREVYLRLLKQVG